MRRWQKSLKKRTNEDSRKRRKSKRMRWWRHSWSRKRDTSSQGSECVWYLYTIIMRVCILQRHNFTACFSTCSFKVIHYSKLQFEFVLFIPYNQDKVWADKCRHYYLDYFNFKSGLWVTTTDPWIFVVLVFTSRATCITAPQPLTIWFKPPGSALSSEVQQFWHSGQWWYWDFCVDHVMHTGPKSIFWSSQRIIWKVAVIKLNLFSFPPYYMNLMHLVIYDMIILFYPHSKTWLIWVEFLSSYFIFVWVLILFLLFCLKRCKYRLK